VASGYNVAKHAGAPMRGRKHKATTRAKMSEAKLGRPQSSEHIKARAAARRGRPTTEAERAHLRRIMEERVAGGISEETRNKLSEAGLGRAVSEKSRQATITRNKARAGEKRGPMSLSDAERQRRVEANHARKGEKQNPDLAEDVKRRKQGAWAQRKAQGLHTTRWYVNRGLPVPDHSTASTPIHQERDYSSSTTTHPKE
jgi:hypothetical protein